MSKKGSKAKKRGKRQKVSLRKRVLGFVLRLGILAIVFGTLFIFSVYLGIFGRIPTKSELSRIKNHSASVVYSHDIKLIGKYFLQNRMTIDNESISPHVKNALVATEDSRFFKHKGLDLISLGRVLVKSVILMNKEQGGGSTISQQLARNLYHRRDFGRMSMPINKVREIFISARLEKVYSKDEVLALYLNTVPFGENVFGIEVAARQFFSKPSSDLNPSESAVLVGMLAANTAYNPRIHPERSQVRRNVVLDRMADQGFISDEKAAALKKEKIRIKYNRIDYNHGPAPYFVEYLRPQVQEILRINHGDDYNIYTDGLVITTSLDSTLQSYANASVNTHLSLLQREFAAHWSGREPWANIPDFIWKAISSSKAYKELVAGGMTSKEAVEEMRKARNVRVLDWESGKGVIKAISPLDSIKNSIKTLQSGFVAMNPADGHILAWVGGRNFEFNKYDHITSRRQVGSTFKPILYTAALLSDIDPCEFISNEVRVYEDYQYWAPENSNGKHEGWYSVKGGLANSVNTISAELIHRTGTEAVVELAEKMGIKSDIPKVPSIALGTADLSLLEMVSSYSSFANLGRPVEAVSLLKIEDWEGNLLWEAGKYEPMDSAFNSETGRVMVEIMKGVVERGTGRALRSVYNIKSDFAGKTGTTQDNADGWFIGYNPAIVAGAWVGADMPAIHFRTTALGSGAHMALPIVGRFMKGIEMNSSYDSIASAHFEPLSEELIARLDCPDFSMEKPIVPLLDRIFDRKVDEEKETRRKLKEARRQTQKEEKKGLFKKIGDIFKKKK